MTPCEREYAQSLDHRDPLTPFRHQFNIPPALNGHEKEFEPVYLCGNSLGLQPKRALTLVREEMEDWGRLGVHGHSAARRPWMPYHRLATAGLAELVGATTQEVVAMNTLTVNLHLLMASFYRPDGARRKILIESPAFPSDRYAAISQLRYHGLDPEADLLEWRPRAGEHTLLIEDLVEILERQGEEISLLLLPGVQYYSGQCLDMEKICELGHQAGCKVGLDLAHAVGNVPLALHDWGPDFAAWCSYKYLNSGPGAVAGAFVHARHLDLASLPKLLGWWGHDESTRFEMGPDFVAAPGAEVWQLSNPPILALAPMLASLELFADAGMRRIREKSVALTGYLEALLTTHWSGRIMSITPDDPAQRGCQLSLQVRDPTLDARRLFEQLEAMNVTADWREPDVIRIAPAPLYNRYEDVFEFVERLGVAADASGI